MSDVLIIEDDASIRQGIEFSLLKEGYSVRSAPDGEKGLHLINEHSPGLLILDLMLPGMSGFEVCRTLRETGSTIPILMLTARTEESDRVLGLDMGADDYVTKPFSLLELLARVRALLRRAEPVSDLPDVLQFADVFVDFNRYLARKGNRAIQLPPKAFGVLQYLAGNQEKVISRDELLNEVWGYDSLPTTRTVDNQVALLRAKLEDDPADPRHIVTVHGIGYRFIQEA